MNRSFLATLAAVAAVPVALAGGYVIADGGPGPRYPSAQQHWIYGPRQTLTTGQKGVVVYCQGKTNSRAFANRERAKPGDVVVQTCRAVRG